MFGDEDKTKDKVMSWEEKGRQFLGQRNMPGFKGSS